MRWLTFAVLVLQVGCLAAVEDLYVAVSSPGSGPCGITVEGNVRCLEREGVDGMSGEYYRVTTDGWHDTTCALLGDGTLECVGQDDRGQHGLVGTGPFQGIEGGYGWTCGIEVNGGDPAGRLRCAGDWGDTRLPGAPTFPAGNYLQVETAARWESAVCALTDAGVAKCVGQIGDPTLTTMSGHKAIAAGGSFNNHVCVLNAEDRVECWGDNDSGQIEAPGGTFKAIAAGYTESTCGIRDDGSIECWGELAGPPDGGTFVDLSIGEDSACGVTTAGELVCW